MYRTSYADNGNPLESSRVWTSVVGAELAVQSQQRRWDDGTRHPQLQPALSSAGTDKWVLNWRVNEDSDSSGDRRPVGSRFHVLGPYAAKLCWPVDAPVQGTRAPGGPRRLPSLNCILSASFVRASFGVRSFSVAALKFATLSLHLSVPIPVLIPPVVTSRPTTASRPFNPINPFLLALQLRLLLIINYLCEKVDTSELEMTQHFGVQHSKASSQCKRALWMGILNDQFFSFLDYENRR